MKFDRKWSQETYVISRCKQRCDHLWCDLLRGMLTYACSGMRPYLIEVMVLFRLFEVERCPLLLTRSSQQVVKHMVIPGRTNTYFTWIYIIYIIIIEKKRQITVSISCHFKVFRLIFGVSGLFAACLRWFTSLTKTLYHFGPDRSSLDHLQTNTTLTKLLYQPCQVSCESICVKILYCAQLKPLETFFDG